MRVVSGNRLHRLVFITFLLVVPLLLGGWRDFTGNTINPNYIKRIKDGKTTKTEILALFGDPKTVQRTDLGPVFKYYSYKDNPPDMPYRPENRQINPQSESQFLLEDHQLKKPTVKTEGEILRSTLTVQFKIDGDTVMSHEYKEF